MKLLITGAHGLLGRTLLETDWGEDVEIVGSARTDDPVGDVRCHAVDITDREALQGLIRHVRPERVIHTAALTNVDRCETEPDLARRVNLEAVVHLVEACDEIGAAVTHLSTDYVFDGSAGPYAETDATHPLSHYGRIKLESEAAVLSARTPGLVVRTLWLYGHRGGAGPNFVTWLLSALVQGGPLRIVRDQWGNPTFVDDLARVLMELGRRGCGGSYHVGGATFLTREELARRVARHFELEADHMDTISTAELGQAAPRPLRSGLRTEAVEAELGWTPVTLEAGLDRLASSPAFARDLGPLIAGAATGRHDRE